MPATTTPRHILAGASLLLAAIAISACGLRSDDGDQPEPTPPAGLAMPEVHTLTGQQQPGGECQFGTLHFSTSPTGDTEVRYVLTGVEPTILRTFSGSPGPFGSTELERNPDDCTMQVATGISVDDGNEPTDGQHDMIEVDPDEVVIVDDNGTPDDGESDAIEISADDITIGDEPAN